MKTRTLFMMIACALGIGFIVTSCNKNDNDNIAASANVPTSNQTEPPQGLGINGSWHVVTTRVFTIETPYTWSLTEMPSMDTYSGLLSGETDSLMFEYGTTMNAYQMDPEHYTYHYETINKLKALIIESIGTPQRYGVAIDSVNTREGTEGRRFILMQSSKTQMDKETAMRMIRSIKFNP